MGDEKYSEIEVETAKNLLAKGYEWIARDKDGTVYAYCTRPVKEGDAWFQGDGLLLLMDGKARGVIPIFDGIGWADSEPVRLRDIVPQILTDEEREWLRVVVRPFRDRLKSVEAYDGAYYMRYIQFCIVPPEGYEEQPSEYDLIQISKDSFTRMEDRKEYTPEELDL